MNTFVLHCHRTMAATLRCHARACRRFFDDCAFAPGRPAKYMATGVSILLIFIGGVALGNLPDAMKEIREINTLRMRATLEPLTLVPTPQEEAAPLSGVVVVRSRVSTESLVVSAPAAALPTQPYGIISFVDGGVSVATTDGSVLVQRLQKTGAAALASSMDPLALDLFAPEASRGASPTLLYGEQLDTEGSPLRWTGKTDSLTGKILSECSLRLTKKDSLQRFMSRMGGTIAQTDPQNRLAKYQEFADQYARKYHLTTGLVLAIMRTESNFNPSVVSNNNAVGLMQIVQSAAGTEVHTYLTGTPGGPSAEALFNPESNIKYGTTYLHLLARRYFNDVTNAASREICMIAAYNGGPNAVLKVFDKDRDIAVAAINALSPEDLYQTLVTNLPTAESRRYVEVVLGHLRNYSTQ